MIMFVYLLAHNLLMIINYKINNYFVKMNVNHWNIKLQTNRNIVNNVMMFQIKCISMKQSNKLNGKDAIIVNIQIKTKFINK